MSTAATITTIAVVGAGTMGPGIAHVAAPGGRVTRIFDASRDALATARQTIERSLAQGLERGKVGRGVYQYDDNSRRLADESEEEKQR